MAYQTSSFCYVGKVHIPILPERKKEEGQGKKKEGERGRKRLRRERWVRRQMEEEEKEMGRSERR